MDKIVILGDSSTFITNILLETLLNAIKKRTDIELGCIVNTAKIEPTPKIKKLLKFLALITVKKAFNPEEKVLARRYTINNLYDICRRSGIDVTVPPERNINSTEFIKFLQRTVKPTICIAIGCPQIMKKAFIDQFDIVVNYHNSLLPKYRGLNATAWSVYYGEELTGFTLHVVDENVDNGNILIQNAVHVSEDMSSFELELQKTMKAGGYMGQLLELFIARSKGAEQIGEPSYFGGRELKAVTTVHDKHELTFNEFQRRLRAFGILKIKFGHQYFHISKIIRKNGNITSSFDFLTNDNVIARPARFNYMPLMLYKAYKSFTNKR